MWVGDLRHRCIAGMGTTTPREGSQTRAETSASYD
jgi:hypothetical protein